MADQKIACLLADVGGTNVRFAWQQRAKVAADGLVFAPLKDIAAYPCAEHESLQAAIAHYLHVHRKPNPQWCAIGIANPVLGDCVQMTNHHWAFSITQLQTTLGVERMRVINDFTALALSLPSLDGSDLHQVGSGCVAKGEAMGLIGPGTGLGVSGLLPSANQTWTPIRGEGGHVSLTASDALEIAVIQWLAKRFGHVSAERVLSGPGLVNLHDALRAIQGLEAQLTQPSEILDRALNDPEGISAQTLQLFCGFLGSVAGDLALTLGARGGVYLGGGILPRIISFLESSSFRKRFADKGRFSAYLDAIPTLVINTQIPAALLGAAAALND